MCPASTSVPCAFVAHTCNLLQDPCMTGTTAHIPKNLPGFSFTLQTKFRNIRPSDLWWPLPPLPAPSPAHDSIASIIGWWGDQIIHHLSDSPHCSPLPLLQTCHLFCLEEPSSLTYKTFTETVHHHHFCFPQNSLPGSWPLCLFYFHKCMKIKVSTSN